jgi:VWFA-related protein
MVHSFRILAYSFLSLVLIAACSSHLSAAASAPSAVSTEPDSSDGLVRLDVTVTDKSGSPVPGLKAEDFTLLDNGQPQKLVSFRTHDEAANKVNEPVEIILLIDALNLTSKQAAVAKQEAEIFLREDQGRLKFPAMVYRLTDKGLWASEQPSTDGNALAGEIASGSEPRAVMETPARADAYMMTSDQLNDRNIHSIQALGAITTEARRRPGRKLLFWLGPGWPVDSVDPTEMAPVEANGEHIKLTSRPRRFDQIVEFSTRLREARISLFCVSMLSYPEFDSSNEGRVRAVQNAKDAAPGDMALNVLASKSGGSASTIASMIKDLIDKSASTIASMIKDLIDKSVEDAGDYYTLTFDPPRAGTPDEYHDLKVTVDRPDAAVRTNSEYYDQPAYYDEPEAREKIAVDQLRQVLETLRTLSDSEAAKRLSGMELTARLSSANAAELRSLVHGQKANEAFTVLADRSAFLPPPAAEIADAPAPAMQEQRLMLNRTIHYLQETFLRLPDLFATRTTVRYEEPAQKQDQTWKIAAADQSLHAAATESVTVLVRNSKETTEGDARAAKDAQKRERSLITEGTFGPMVAQVLVDAADPHSQLKWSRWERDAHGQRAVFHYAVPSKFAHFNVSFCCLADPDGTVPFNSTSAYHGEITIDPVTGAIYRITAEADLLPRLPIDRSEVMVEFSPIVIGSQTNICPVRSVSISRSRRVILLHYLNMAFGIYGPFESILNDVTFSNYHLFGSQHRILTDDSPAP